MQEKYLYDTLTEYCDSDHYPFHMPGHKRRLGGLTDPFAFDITEIDGFDNLHHAEGIILEAEQRAAKLYGAEETHFLVNGSTAGILCAIGACAPSGKILIARNSHKAAYHAVLLNRLEAVYLYPERYAADWYQEINGPISPDEVEAKLKRDPDIRAVFITSPTYDGVVSDVEKIVSVVHRYGLPLIVDEAHGAHFGMHPIFPENSVKLGADIVIHSLHKTLPSLTQTALIHVNGTLVDRRRLRKLLGIYQSSSPSYVLMSGIDQCIRIIKEQGEELFECFAEMLNRFRTSVKDLKVLRLIATDDPSKILISSGNSGLTGLELSEILRERYHLELEMAAGSYSLALTSVGDSAEGFTRLSEALLEMDKELLKVDEELLEMDEELPGVDEELPEVDKELPEMDEELPEMDKELPEVDEELPERNKEPMQMSTAGDDAGKNTEGRCQARLRRNEIIMTVFEAENAPQSRIALEESEGCISGEYVYLYPPGIPLVVPGERIDRELLEEFVEYKAKGYSLQGMEDYEMEYIWIIREDRYSNYIV